MSLHNLFLFHGCYLAHLIWLGYPLLFAINSYVGPQYFGLALENFTKTGVNIIFPFGQ